jgi:hypothetical protein
MVFGSMGGASSSGSGAGYSLLDCQPKSRCDHHWQRCGIVSSRTTGTERPDPGVIIAKATASRNWPFGEPVELIDHTPRRRGMSLAAFSF